MRSLTPGDEENIQVLAMLNDYINPALTMKEFCVKCKRHLKFTPVKGSQIWEEVIFCMEKECDEILKDKA